jgi:flagellar hook-length control protein FliK
VPVAADNPVGRAQPGHVAAEAPAATTPLPASAAGPAAKAGEMPSPTATTKQPNHVAAAHRQSPAAASLAADEGAAEPTGQVNARAVRPAFGPEQSVTVQVSDPLSSRPSATLGGAAATAAMAQTGRPGTAKQSATGTTTEATLSGAAKPASAQSAPPSKGAEVAAAAAGDRIIQATLPPGSGGTGTGGDGTGQSAGQFSSTSAPLPGGTTAGATPTQSASFAEAMANARNASAANPAEQIAVQVRRAQAAGQEQINIKLHPAELGRIEVRLENGPEGTLRAVISAERSETLDLLQRDARGLERALQEAGVKTDSGSLNFNLRGQGQQQQTAEDGAARGAASGDGTAAGQLGDAGPPTPHHAGPRHDGALDIRV